MWTAPGFVPGDHQGGDPALLLCPRPTVPGPCRTHSCVNTGLSEGGAGEGVGPPLVRFWESNLGLMEMYAPSGHGTFTQGGPVSQGPHVLGESHGRGGGGRCEQ